MERGLTKITGKIVFLNMQNVQKNDKQKKLKKASNLYIT